jgi:hypothetical protein
MKKYLIYASLISVFGILLYMQFVTPDVASPVTIAGFYLLEFMAFFFGVSSILSGAKQAVRSYIISASLSFSFLYITAAYSLRELNIFTFLMVVLVDLMCYYVLSKRKT